MGILEMIDGYKGKVYLHDTDEQADRIYAQNRMLDAIRSEAEKLMEECKELNADRERIVNEKCFDIMMLTKSEEAFRKSADDQFERANKMRDERDAALSRIAALEAEKAELLDEVFDMAHDDMIQPSGYLVTDCKSSQVATLKLLEKHGKVRIMPNGTGRYQMAEIIEKNGGEG